MKNFKRILSLMLILVMALSFAACGNKSQEEETDPYDGKYAKVFELGETEFEFEVINKEGETTLYLVKTDKETVGDALLETELISGEESQYGLYVTTVDGLTLDYNADKYYWAFYVDGQYAEVGVDSMEVVPGAKYSFVAEQSQY